MAVSSNFVSFTRETTAFGVHEHWSSSNSLRAGFNEPAAKTFPPAKSIREVSFKNFKVTAIFTLWTADNVIYSSITGR